MCTEISVSSRVICIALSSQVWCTLHAWATVCVLGWHEYEVTGPAVLEEPTRYCSDTVSSHQLTCVMGYMCLCVCISCLFNTNVDPCNECIVCPSPMCVCLEWRSKRAPGRTGVWLARAAEICSFPLVNASLPLTLPRATASPSHNHSDTISSSLLIFFHHPHLLMTYCPSLSFHRLTIQLKCLLYLCSYWTLFKVYPLCVGCFFPLSECSFPWAHLSFSALHLNSQKAIFVLTAWQPLHHLEWMISSTPFHPSTSLHFPS